VAKEASSKDPNSEYSLESGDGSRSCTYCMTADGSTALSHSDSALLSLLSRRWSPTPSGLECKRKVRHEHPPKGLKQEKDL